jgi:hypothetical protein
METRGWKSWMGALLLMAAVHMDAQMIQPAYPGSFKNALGLRVGGTSGLSYKHWFSRYQAAEVIAGRTHYAYGITGLYERFVPTTATGLSVFFGGGAHFGKAFAGRYLMGENGRVLDYSGGAGYSDPFVGVDGIIGLEYLFGELPLSASAELKPCAEFGRWQGSRIVRLDPGLGLRFHF